MATLTATALPQQFSISGSVCDPNFEPILAALTALTKQISVLTVEIDNQSLKISNLETKVAQLDDAITAQAAAIAANTTATNNAVAAMGSAGVSQAQLDAIAKNTADIQANTVTLATATPPPAVP